MFFIRFSSDTSEPPVPEKKVKPVTKGQFLLIELPELNEKPAMDTWNATSRCGCCCRSSCCSLHPQCCCTPCWNLWKMIVGEYFKRVFNENSLSYMNFELAVTQYLSNIFIKNISFCNPMNFIMKINRIYHILRICIYAKTNYELMKTFSIYV